MLALTEWSQDIIEGDVNHPDQYCEKLRFSLKNYSYLSCQ